MSGLLGLERVWGREGIEDQLQLQLQLDHEYEDLGIDHHGIFRRSLSNLRIYRVINIFKSSITIIDIRGSAQAAIVVIIHIVVMHRPRQ